MREIKFRAWIKYLKEMLEVAQVHIEQNSTGSGSVIMDSHNDLHALADIELMQFTGLYDVNGKEIYEGDIIKHRYFSKKGIADVRWSNEQGYYLAIEPDGSRTMLNANSEIIGNIHENPELLTSS